MIKIFHTSDWHIDQLNGWGKADSFGIYHLEKIEEMVNEAIEQKIQIFIFAGDLYKNSTSNYKSKDYANKELIRLINKLEINNIETIFIS